MSKKAFDADACAGARAERATRRDDFSAAMRSSSGLSGVRPSLSMAAMSMQLAYSSPIFCSLGVRFGAGFDGLFENLPQVQAVQFVQLGEAAVRRLVRRQRIALEPAIAAVAVEVFAGIDGLVDQRSIEDTQLRLSKARAMSVILAEGRMWRRREQSTEGRKEGLQRLSGTWRNSSRLGWALVVNL